METLGSLPSSKCSPRVPVLTQINPVQAPIPFLEGIFLILFSNLSLNHPSGFVPSSFPHHASHMPRPSHSSCFDHPNKIRWSVSLRSCSLCAVLKFPVKYTRHIILESSNLYWLSSHNEISSPSNYHFRLALKQTLGGPIHQYDDLKEKTVMIRYLITQDMDVYRYGIEKNPMSQPRLGLCQNVVGYQKNYEICALQWTVHDRVT